eukprot:PhF_6_TR42820/c0_g1_i1/m.64829
MLSLEAEEIHWLMRCNRIVQMDDYRTYEYFRTFPYHVFPPAIRIKIFEFFDILPMGTFNELQTIRTTVQMLNNKHADESDSALSTLAEATQLLQRHRNVTLSLFQEYADGFGVLEHTTTHNHYHPYLLQLKTSLHELKNTESGWAVTSSWVRDIQRWKDTPCYVLANTFRDLVSAYEVLFEQQSRMGNGTSVHFNDALSEYNSVMARVGAVERIGAETIEYEDIVSAFRHAGTPFPEGVDPETYHRGITFGQALSLGLLDVPWIRGYVWEEKELRLKPKKETPLQTQHEHYDVDFHELERRASTICPYSNEEKLHRICALMSRRLWTVSDRYTTTHNRKFTGCEMCHKVHLQCCGFLKPGEAAVEDIVLCKNCYLEHYGNVESVLHRMYWWVDLKDVITTTA